MKRNLLKLPGILSDIDGVVHRGYKVIPGSDRAIKTLLREHRTADGQVARVPFVLVTNGGGYRETNFAKSLNNMVFGSDAPQPAGQHIFQANQLVECHTPLRTLLPAYHDKFVLVAGYKETIEAVHDYGFKKAIHSEELLGLWPELAPLPARTIP